MVAIGSEANHESGTHVQSHFITREGEVFGITLHNNNQAEIELIADIIKNNDEFTHYLMMNHYEFSRTRSDIRHISFIPKEGLRITIISIPCRFFEIDIDSNGETATLQIIDHETTPETVDQLAAEIRALVSDVEDIQVCSIAKLLEKGLPVELHAKMYFTEC